MLVVRASRSHNIVYAILTVAAISSLVILKIFVVGGGFALPFGSAQTATTVISVTGTSAITTSADSNVNYSGTPSIFVSAENPNGTTISGVFTTLVQNEKTIASAYTPVVFRVASGQSYQLIVSDSNGLYFNQWSNGFSSSVIPITSNSSEIALKAIFTKSPQSPPPTPYSISVASSLLNGSTLTGTLVDLRVDGYPIQDGYTPVTFSNLEPGLRYQVVVYWYGDNYFRHFSDGDLDRYQTVTFNSTGSPDSVSYDALYEHIPSSEVVSLNVIAEFTNGTVIGTAYNATTYIQHTPGVWVTVTPAGVTSAYAGSDTGGSLLPFILVAGQSYAVEMSSYGQYTFEKWKDTGSTDPARIISMSDNTTLIAVYS